MILVILDNQNTNNEVTKICNELGSYQRICKKHFDQSLNYKIQIMNPIYTKLDSLNQNLKNKIRIISYLTKFQILKSKTVNCTYTTKMMGKKVEYFVLLIFWKRDQCVLHICKSVVLYQKWNEIEKVSFEVFFALAHFFLLVFP